MNETNIVTRWKIKQCRTRWQTTQCNTHTTKSLRSVFQIFVRITYTRWWQRIKMFIFIFR